MSRNTLDDDIIEELPELCRSKWLLRHADHGFLGGSCSGRPLGVRDLGFALSWPDLESYRTWLGGRPAMLRAEIEAGGWALVELVTRGYLRGGPGSHVPGRSRDESGSVLGP